MIPAAALDDLAAAPDRIAAAVDGVDDDLLHAPPAPEEWSANEVLAHLRACSDVWGGVIRRMLDEDEPTIRAMNPRSVTISDAFGPSHGVFTGQRYALVEVLRSLHEEQWDRGATITGAGAPMRKTVRDYVDRLHRHERTHLKQLVRAIGAG